MHRQTGNGISFISRQNSTPVPKYNYMKTGLVLYNLNNNYNVLTIIYTLNKYVISLPKHHA